MTQAKTKRPPKRQLGQFMTPLPLAERLVNTLEVSVTTRVLEPGFGDGSFILPLIRKFLPLYDGPISERLERVLNQNVYGVELDPSVYARCLERIQRELGRLPASHNLVCDDFFRFQFFPDNDDSSLQPRLFGDDLGFDLIVGNPPFGGTIAADLQDALDRQYGTWNGDKIKKETYSFFLVRALRQLTTGGRLLFICSDTFLTIPTMRGLRKLLMEHANVKVRTMDTFSDETAYPMVVLDLEKNGKTDCIQVDDKTIPRRMMELTGNYSWAITEDAARYFGGGTLGDFVVCSSGMTIGKNELFVREIRGGGIVESYAFEFFDDPVTLHREIQRARLHKLSPKQVKKIEEFERAGITRRNVRVVARAMPVRIELPHPDYQYYNKAASGIIYAPPSHAIFWKDDGDAVQTFKKNGNWYLHGVGGKPYFGRSGLTWQLVASRLNVRYLPAGYILDSGAPCAFLRPGVQESELHFILGWTCTALCSRILKTVINHTMNIQSKDFERLPYPHWVVPEKKAEAISVVQNLVARAMAGEAIERGHPEVRRLESLYAHPDRADPH